MIDPNNDIIVGSRAVEIAYASNPAGFPLGNFLATGLMQLNQSGGSRVVEVPYVTSPNVS